MTNHSPFGYLLRRSLLPGKTAFGESNTVFQMPRIDDATLLLFRTDEISRAAKGEEWESFDKHFGLADQKRSDLVLLLIKKDAKSNDHMTRLAAIELKATANLSDAIDQLANTLRALKQNLQPLLGKSFFSRGNLRALIVATATSKGSAADAKRVKQFEAEFHCKPEICNPRHEDNIRKALGV